MISHVSRNGKIIYLHYSYTTSMSNYFCMSLLINTRIS